MINRDHKQFLLILSKYTTFILILLQGLLLVFIILDVCGGAKLISNGVNERNVNFIDDPSNVAIDFSRKVTFQSTKAS